MDRCFSYQNFGYPYGNVASLPATSMPTGSEGMLVAVCRQVGAG